MNWEDMTETVFIICEKSVFPHRCRIQTVKNEVLQHHLNDNQRFFTCFYKRDSGFGG